MFWLATMTHSTLESFNITLFFPSLNSPPQCLGRMWHWCWGGHTEVVSVVTSGRAPQWRRASWETGGGARPLDRCRGSVCTPGPVSGWNRLHLLYWTLVSHFPGERGGGRNKRKVVEFVTVRKKDPIEVFYVSSMIQWDAQKVSYQVDVTELVQPEVVDGGGDGWEVVGLKAGVTVSNSSAQPGQNPPVWHTLLSIQLRVKIVTRRKCSNLVNPTPAVSTSLMSVCASL